MIDQPNQAGWYPAPDAAGQLRYFDGRTWTNTYAPTVIALPAAKRSSAWIVIPVLFCLVPAVLAVVSIMAVTFLGTTAEEGAAAEGGPTAVSGAEEAGAEDVHPVGGTATTSDLQVTVHTVQDPWVPTVEWDTPPGGRRYVGVEMTLVNTDSRTTTFSTLLGVEVVDGEGRAGDIALTTSDQPDIGGDIPPGASRRGWVYFSVPQDATNLEVRIRGSLTADGAVFSLG